eukprot:TRINITY_DN8205_c3_g1_i2.p1 TRINITY_DN8205_c3_g1~~TRINITY_DN8205_c3_g1_i2.p1  ORF type:complete len:1218 (-),score=365.06 TRINITY_DN8205_c3_g1_i2:111-3713(-)
MATASLRASLTPAERLFEALDSNDDGTISREEFNRLIASLPGVAGGAPAVASGAAVAPARPVESVFYNGAWLSYFSEDYLRSRATVVELRAHARMLYEVFRGEANVSAVPTADDQLLAWILMMQRRFLAPRLAAGGGGIAAQGATTAANASFVGANMSFQAQRQLPQQPQMQMQQPQMQMQQQQVQMQQVQQQPLQLQQQQLVMAPAPQQPPPQLQPPPTLPMTGWPPPATSAGGWVSAPPAGAGCGMGFASMSGEQAWRSAAASMAMATPPRPAPLPVQPPPSPPQPAPVAVAEPMSTATTVVAAPLIQPPPAAAAPPATAAAAVATPVEAAAALSQVSMTPATQGAMPGNSPRTSGVGVSALLDGREVNIRFREKYDVRPVEKPVAIPTVTVQERIEEVPATLVRESIEFVPEVRKAEIVREIAGELKYREVVREVPRNSYVASERVEEVPLHTLTETVVEIPEVKEVELRKEVPAPGPPQVKMVQKEVERPIYSEVRERQVEVPLVTRKEELAEVTVPTEVELLREVPVDGGVSRVETSVPKPELRIATREEEVVFTDYHDQIEEIAEVEVHEIVRQVPKIEVQIVERQVPIPVVQYVEKIVEVPYTVYEERVVEVPQVEVREVVKQVTKLVPRYVDRQVPKQVINVVPRQVDVPTKLVEERAVEVPQVNTVELVREVPRPTTAVVQKEVPIYTDVKAVQRVEDVPCPMQHERIKEVLEVKRIDVTKRVQKAQYEVREKVVPRITGTEASMKIVEVPQILRKEHAVEVPEVLVAEARHEVAESVVQQVPKEVPRMQVQYRQRLVEMSAGLGTQATAGRRGDGTGAGMQADARREMLLSGAEAEEVEMEEEQEEESSGRGFFANLADFVFGEDRKPGAEVGKNDVFARFDGNGDGVITREEFLTMADDAGAVSKGGVGFASDIGAVEKAWQSGGGWASTSTAASGDDLASRLASIRREAQDRRFRGNADGAHLKPTGAVDLDLFDSIDRDGSGRISREEFLAALSDGGTFRRSIPFPGPSPLERALQQQELQLQRQQQWQELLQQQQQQQLQMQQLGDVFAAIDANGNGRISKEEFVNFVSGRGMAAAPDASSNRGGGSLQAPVAKEAYAPVARPHADRQFRDSHSPYVDASYSRRAGGEAAGSAPAEVFTALDPRGEGRVSRDDFLAAFGGAPLEAAEHPPEEDLFFSFTDLMPELK